MTFINKILIQAVNPYIPVYLVIGLWPEITDKLKDSKRERQKQMVAFALC